MLDLLALIRNFLIIWNQEAYILLRIRFVAVLLLLLYIMMFVLVSQRFRRIRGGGLNLLDAVSDSILAYILGAMQAAPFKNKLFPVWALVLVSFRSSVNSLSRYGTYTELRNILKLVAVAYMNITQGSKIWRIPFWVFWSFLVLRSLNRIYARRIVSKSLWLGRSSELLQDYMGSSLAPDGSDPTTMAGYRYLVYGESKQSRGSTGPSLGIDDSRSLVTLDMIWRCPQLRWIRAGGILVKELCLAFALSRLLRCRLEGATLHVASVNMTRKLICSRIITSDDGAESERTLFEILEQDLMFLDDYLHTSYPMIFSEGLRSLAFTFLQSFVRYSMVVWLAMDLRTVISRDLSHVYIYKGINVDVIITWIAMCYIILMDLWEMVRYLLSNWAKVLYVCKYVSSSQMVLFMRPLVSRAMALLISSQIERPRVRIMIDQYVILQSFNDKSDGTKLSASIHVPLAAKVQVVEALSSLRDMNLEAYSLPRYFTPLRSQYWLACLQLPTCSHVILVLHIATSICEMRLAQDRGMDLRNPGFLSTAITRLFGSSQNFLVDERFLDGDLRTNYSVANSLSRYCAYLLVYKPDLLPDAVLVAKKVFRETLWHAREMLKERDSLQSIYSKLISPSQEAVEPAGGQGSISLSGNIVEQGIKLGKEMIHSENEEHRLWRLLAEVWVNLLVHVAPSSNAEAHAKCLESGGEFLTIIWALFCHCGIEKSELWHPENAAPTINGVDSTGVQQTVSPGAPSSST